MLRISLTSTLVGLLAIRLIPQAGKSPVIPPTGEGAIVKDVNP
jgi:hypothetical protein